MATQRYPSVNGTAIPETPVGSNATIFERDALLAVAEVVVLAVILVMALLSNGLVLMVLLRRGKRHSPLHQFMLNLCVADLVVALFQVTHRHTHKDTHNDCWCVDESVRTLKSFRTYVILKYI